MKPDAYFLQNININEDICAHGHVVAVGGLGKSQ